MGGEEEQHGAKEQGRRIHEALVLIMDRANGKVSWEYQLLFAAAHTPVFAGARWRETSRSARVLVLGSWFLLLGPLLLASAPARPEDAPASTSTSTVRAS